MATKSELTKTLYYNKYTYNMMGPRFRAKKHSTLKVRICIVKNLPSSESSRGHNIIFTYYVIYITSSQAVR